MASAEREPITGVWRRSRLPYPCKNSSDLYQFQERPLAKVGWTCPPRGNATETHHLIQCFSSLPAKPTHVRFNSTEQRTSSCACTGVPNAYRPRYVATSVAKGRIQQRSVGNAGRKRWLTCMKAWSFHCLLQTNKALHQMTADNSDHVSTCHHHSLSAVKPVPNSPYFTQCRMPTHRWQISIKSTKLYSVLVLK